jgi:hypothetical protein
MIDLYHLVVVIATTLLAGLTSIRIAYVLAQRWGFKRGEPTVFFCIGAAAAAGVACCVASVALVSAGGPFYGLVGLIAAIPLVGASWIFVVGANKAIERILSNLLKKVS